MPKPSLFGKSEEKPKETAEQPKTSLFGSKPAETTPQKGLFGGETKPSLFGGDQTPKSTFGGGATASPFGSTTSQTLFGNNAEKPKTGLFGSSNNEAKPSPGLFGSSTNNASSGSMFGEKKEEPKPAGLFGGSGGGFGGLGKVRIFLSIMKLWYSI